MWAALSPPQFLTPEEAQTLPPCPLPLAAATPSARVAVVVVQPITPLVTPQPFLTTLLRHHWKPPQKNVDSEWRTGRPKINQFSD